MTARSPLAVDAAVLGQLLLVESLVAQLPSRETMIQFVERGLAGLPGVRDVRFTPHDASTASARSFPVQRADRTHGFLVFELAEPLVFMPYEPFLANFAFMLGVVLEERAHRAQLEEQRLALERMVEARTRDLAAAAEDAIRHRRRTELYLEVAEAIILELDTDGCISTINALGCTLLGRPEEELLGRNWFEVALPPELHTSVRAVFADVMAERSPLVAHYENDIINARGERRRVAWHNLVRRDEHGRIVGGLSSGIDVTARREAEAARAESERRFTRVFELFPHPLLIVRQDDLAIDFANPAFYALFGYPRGAFRTVDDFVTGAHVEGTTDRPAGRRASAGRGATGRRLPLAHEARVRCADGHRVEVAWSTVPLDDEHVMLFAEDLTARRAETAEREALQQQLHQSRKMEAVGLLAGGVAHDLNNVLSGIVGYPELLLLELPELHPWREPLSIIQDSGNRAAAIVQDLLTMARGAASPREPRDLNTLVATCVESQEFRSLQARHPRVRARLALAPDLPAVACSPSHITKSLVNLIANAMEAIDDQGEVVLATHALDVDAASGLPLAPGPYVVLSVQDDGPGIAEADRERVFEPFYTRKVMGRSGTGLGLTVVWNTVQDHGGHVQLESEPGRTRFELFLPAAARAAAPLPGQDDLSALRGHGERILVVDDEKLQREVASRLLERLGYAPVAVESGERALEASRREAYDLVLLDMIMPGGIGGRETYERLAALRPGQRAIITSGYAETAEVLEAQRLGAGAFLKKPYGLNELGRTVQRALAR